MLLRRPLHLDDELLARGILAAYVNDALSRIGRLADKFVVDELHIHNADIGNDGVQEVDSVLLVGFRAEDALEGEIYRRVGEPCRRNQ